MSRDIKFRIIYQGKVVDHISLVEMMNKCEPWIFSGENFEQIMVKDCTLDEFTGLHDKNGKEIFEGDIVDFSMLNRKYIVEWHGEGWVLFDGTWKYATADGYRPRDGFGWARTEIIGNIHQNPELLKQDGPEKSKDSA